MAEISKIEWTFSSWNPLTGCTGISPGCENCYAELMARRLHSMGQEKYRNCFTVTTHEKALSIPDSWARPRVIFVNSMGDLFHKDVPIEFIKKIFSVMNRVDRHTYQILTKRSGRLAELDSELHWNPHIWVGVSVENPDYLYRIDDLRKSTADIKFISFEPLLSEIYDVDLTGIDWVIVGGESGPHARPIRKEWIIRLRDICLDRDIPFFFKQWGGSNRKASGRMLDGRVWEEMPDPSKQMRLGI